MLIKKIEPPPTWITISDLKLFFCCLLTLHMSLKTMMCGRKMDFGIRQP